MAISDEQRKTLRGLAHALKPVVLVGDKGLSENVLHEVDAALTAHELIKVQLRVGDRAERDALIKRMRAETSSNLVQRIGNVAVLYRKHPKKPKILP